MDIYKLSNTSVLLKFSNGNPVVANPIEKSSKIQEDSTIIGTYLDPRGEWGGDFKLKDGQKEFLGGGEYERGGVFLNGFNSKTELDGKEIQTTSWLVENDGIKIFILGDIESKKDLQDALSEITDVDVIIYFAIKTKEKRLGQSDLGGISASLQSKRLLIVGNDDDYKKKIAKEIGNSEDVNSKYSIKKKDLNSSESKAVLFN